MIIDISHHQPSHKIDWEKASKEVSFFIIRVQYGSTSIDREYKKHVANCKKYGIPFGHYAYARFVSVEDAKVEAKDFLDRMDKDAKFLVVDVEEQTTREKDTMALATQAFIETCKREGHRVGLYTGHHFYKPYHMDKVKADFLWIPRYGTNNGKPQTKPDYPCDLWQYTSVGRVSWYDGNLDLNKIHGDKDLGYFIGKQVKSEVVYNLPQGILKRGDEGEKVKSLQRVLNAVNFKCGAVDGKYGPKTEDAVKRFQSMYADLVDDGIYGPHTRSFLLKVL